MSDLVNKVELIRVADSSPIAATIVLGLEERHFLDHERQWRPLLVRSARDAQERCRNADGEVDIETFRTELARLRLEDFHWDWRKLAALFGDDPRYVFAAIECEGRTQGLLMVETEDHATRLDPKGDGLAYIERLSSAPWNRTTLVAQSEVELTGYALVTAAIRISQESGFDGRIALHSVPGAVGFYTNKCGMTSLGPDQLHQGMLYFEMSAAHASDFIAQFTARRSAR